MFRCNFQIILISVDVVQLSQVRSPGLTAIYHKTPGTIQLVCTM